MPLDEAPELALGQAPAGLGLGFLPSWPVPLLQVSGLTASLQEGLDHPSARDPSCTARGTCLGPSCQGPPVPGHLVWGRRFGEMSVLTLRPRDLPLTVGS